MSYTRTASLPHRTVTAAEPAPVAEINPTQQVISTTGYTGLSLWLALDGAMGAASCTVVPHWYDPETHQWYRDAQQSFTLADAGRAVYNVRPRAQLCRFIVMAMIGTRVEIRFGLNRDV